MHGVGQESLQGSTLARGLLFQPSEEACKLIPLLALRKNLSNIIVFYFM